MRVQVYTNDREEPIDLEVPELGTGAREMSTNEYGQHKDPSVDQSVWEVIKDPTIGASANFLLTTPDGKEGAIHLSTEKVAAAVTSWAHAHIQVE